MKIQPYRRREVELGVGSGVGVPHVRRGRGTQCERHSGEVVRAWRRKRSCVRDLGPWRGAREQLPAFDQEPIKNRTRCGVWSGVFTV